MEELRYGARLSETSVGPCSSGLWQRLTQCSPAAYSCRCTTACSRSMKSLGIDVRMSATKLDAKVVGTRPASRTRPTQRAQSARWAASLHSAMWSNGLWSRILLGSARTLSTSSHSLLLVERPEKVGEGQQQRGGGPRVRVRHDAEQGEPVEDEGGKVETHQRGGRAHHRVDIRTAAVDAEDGGVVDPAPLPREEQHPEEDPKVGEEEHRAEEGVVQRRDRLHAGSLGAGDDEADQQHEERAGDAGTEAEGEEGPLEPIHRDLPNLIRAEPVVELEAGDRRDGGL